MEKLINKFLDYCFKHLENVSESYPYKVIFTHNNFEVRLLVNSEMNKVYLTFGKYSASISEDEVPISSNAEVNLIKYKLEKLFYEKRESQIKELENIIEDKHPIQMITNIDEFEYDEDKC